MVGLIIVTLGLGSFRGPHPPSVRPDHGLWSVGIHDRLTALLVISRTHRTGNHS